jgi:hypothetical protein
MAISKSFLLGVAGTLLLRIQICSALELQDIRPQISHSIEERGYTKRWYLSTLDLQSTETFLWGGVGKKGPDFPS